MSTAPQEFPADFPIKVMGRQDSDLRALTQAIVERHAGAMPESRVKTRTSADGNFLALTYTVHATSKEQTRQDLPGIDSLQVGVDGAVVLDFRRCGTGMSVASMAQLPQQMRQQALCHGLDAELDPQIRKPRHAQILIAAHIDAFKGCQVERHVQRHAVIAGAAPNAQADARQFRALHIDAGRFPRARRRDAQIRRESR